MEVTGQNTTNNHSVLLLAQRYKMRGERRTDKSAMHVARTTAKRAHGMASMTLVLQCEISRLTL